MGLTQRLGTIPLAIQTDSSNNVGIGGTPSGSFKFEAIGLTRLASSGATILTINSTNANGSANVYQQSGTNIGWIGNGSSSLIGGSTNDFTINGQTNINLAIGGFSRVIVNSSGNVGIGTSSPSFNLSVRGSGDGVIYAVGANNTFKAEMQVEGAGQFTGSLVAVPSASSTYGGIPTSCIGITTSSTPLVFATNNTERMRITSGGQLQIKQSGNTFSDGLRLINTANNTWTTLAGGDNDYYFGYNGNAAAKINSAGTYTAFSDRNRKKDFEESNIGLDAILGLKPTLYRIKTDDENADKQLGFIAQEVKDFIPQAYSESINGDETFIGLNYNAIVTVLVKAIQELNAKVTALENK